MMGQMTRRDYELVSDSVRLCRDTMPLMLRQNKPANAEANFDIDMWATGLAFAAAEYIAGTLANGFKEQNKAFDVERFMKNCGVRGED